MAMGYLTTLQQSLDSAYMEASTSHTSIIIGSFMHSSERHCVTSSAEVRRFPSQPRKESIKVDWVREDRRPEFFGRAEVKISWNRPEGLLEHRKPSLQPNAKM